MSIGRLIDRAVQQTNFLTSELNVCWLQARFPNITSLAKGEPGERKRKLDISKVRRHQASREALAAAVSSCIYCPGTPQLAAHGLISAGAPPACHQETPCDS